MCSYFFLRRDLTVFLKNVLQRNIILISFGNVCLNFQCSLKNILFLKVSGLNWKVTNLKWIWYTMPCYLRSLCLMRCRLRLPRVLHKLPLLELMWVVVNFTILIADSLEEPRFQQHRRHLARSMATQATAQELGPGAEQMRKEKLAKLMRTKFLSFISWVFSYVFVDIAPL